MGVRADKVEVHIRELSVDEPASIDRLEFSNALQAELTRLLSTALRLAPADIKAVSNRTADSIKTELHGSGAAAAAKVAHALYREVQK